MTTNPSPDPDDVRPHSFDGIYECNRRLPNWWLMILYGCIVFWIGYWAYFQWFRIGLDGPAQITAEMAKIEAARLANTPATDDVSLWQMSRNAVIVTSGRATFNTICASCHTEKLTGGIGPNLVDKLWIHGGNPAAIYKIIDEGFLAKGMPAWGQVLGHKKAAEVAAYVMSYHTEGEPTEVQAAWTPISPK